MFRSPLGLTVILALLTATMLLLAAIPIAYGLAFSRTRWTVVGESLVSLTLVLPPAVLGYGILVLFSPRNPFGHLVATGLGHPLPFSFAGLVLASILYSLPFAVQPVVQSFRSIPPGYLESATSLGAGRFVRLVRVILPLSFEGILTGWVLSFAHTVGEFGVVLMVGGNIPGETRTLSLAAYDALLSMEPGRASRAIGILLLFSLGSLLALNLIQQRRRWTDNGS